MEPGGDHGRDSRVAGRQLTVVTQRHNRVVGVEGACRGAICMEATLPLSGPEGGGFSEGGRHLAKTVGAAWESPEGEATSQT